MSHEYQNYKGQILGENPSGETKRIQVDENGNLLTSTSISNQVEIMGFGMVDTTPVLDPDQLTANQLGLLRGLLKQLQDGTMKTEINGSLANQTLAESSKTEVDAVLGVVTFSDVVACIEIYNSDAVNTGTFNVNGIDIVVPPSKVWKDAIGGTPSAEVTISGATTYILNRFV